MSDTGRAPTMRAMKSPFALPACFLLMLLALLPFGAQAHGKTAPCAGHAAAGISAGHAAHSAHQTLAAASAATAANATAAADAAPHHCHHRGTRDCRCTQACGAASALPLALHSPLSAYSARSEMPRHGRTVATRAPPPIDLLRPPTRRL